MDLLTPEMVTSVTGMLAAIGAFIISYRNSRDIKVVHTNTNSIKDALVASTRALALIEGAEQERIRVAANAALKALGAKEAQDRRTASAAVPAAPIPAVFDHSSPIPVVVDQSAGDAVPVEVLKK